MEVRDQSAPVYAPACVHIRGDFARALVCPAGVDGFAHLELSSQARSTVRSVGRAVLHLGCFVLDRVMDTSNTDLQLRLEDDRVAICPPQHLRKCP